MTWITDPKEVQEVIQRACREQSAAIKEREARLQKQCDEFNVKYHVDDFVSISLGNDTVNIKTAGRAYVAPYLGPVVQLKDLPSLHFLEHVYAPLVEVRAAQQSKGEKT